MIKGFQFFRLNDAVVLNLKAEDPQEAAGKFLEFLKEFEVQSGQQVPLVQGEDGTLGFAVGSREYVPLPREVIKTLIKIPTLVVTVSNEIAGEEIVRFSLNPEALTDLL